MIHHRLTRPILVSVITFACGSYIGYPTERVLSTSMIGGVLFFICQGIANREGRRRE